MLKAVVKDEGRSAVSLQYFQSRRIAVRGDSDPQTGHVASYKDRLVTESRGRLRDFLAWPDHHGFRRDPSIASAQKRRNGA